MKQCTWREGRKEGRKEGEEREGMECGEGKGVREGRGSNQTFWLRH